MAITYGFFNSVDGDRQYNADDLNHVVKCLVSDGIYPEPDECLMVEPPTTSEWKIRINAGTAIVQSHYFTSTTKTELNLESPSSQKRIDRIVLRLDVDERSIGFAVIKGTPNRNPSAPDIIRNGRYWDLALADVTIDGEKGMITFDDIKDQRNNPQVCGIITGLVRSNGYIDGYFNRVMTKCDEIQNILNDLKVAEEFEF